MHVYRIEHRETGFGPYNPAPDMPDNVMSLCYLLRDAHSNFATHPAFHLWDCRAGFSSLRKMKTWFSGFEESLAKCDYVIKEYIATYWKHDPARKQLVFIPETARCVDSYEIAA